MDIKEYFKVSEVFTYFFRKKDPNRKTNTSLKMMHWTNKISIVMFLIAMLIMLYRAFLR